MTAFKHILVPTDFGETSARAVDIAIELARKFDAELTRISTRAGSRRRRIRPTPRASTGPPTRWRARRGRSCDTTVARVKTLYAKTDGVIGQGEPWQQVLTVANERGADLIVMATHGRTGLSRVFLGSVAEKVVRLSPIPVLTVSGSDAAKEARASTGPTGTPDESL